ncbi:MAG TPA: BadF/BadG/BcrA/BcrD ATPase family protein [Thermoanaerobaculia bacterium]|nr:BadF/BadG/BcrA/BcrD ATPase family protein [Thermoanaerobaculia bacterium]
MEPMRYLVGVDAGGSKTVGLLADESGRVLAEERGPGANLHIHGELAVEQTLANLLGRLRAHGEPAAACFGIAGADRESDRERLRMMLRRLGISMPVRIVHDAVIALAAGAPERFGIVVVAGTGSIAYGEDRSGGSARSGGWGYLLGDEGSALWLARVTLRSSVRAADGRGPRTSLTTRIAEALGVDIPAGLVAWGHSEEALRERISRILPLLEEAVDDGDPVAWDIVDEAARHLARAAESVARQLDLEGPVPVVLAGGAFRACATLAEQLEARLELPEARVRRLEVEPAVGGVVLARELLSKEPSEAPSS